MREKMSPSTITHGLWAKTAGKKPELPTISQDCIADTVIIGGGYTGLSAALHLAQAGKDVILLEANNIGYGGAGRNVGLVNAGLWLMPEDVIKIAGDRYGRQLIRVLGDSPDLVYGLIEKHNIDCEAVRNGTLHCADTKKGLNALEQREKQWKERGAPVRLLQREEAAAKTGTHQFYGALLDKRAGTVQPLSYAYGLAKAAVKAGATLYEKSPVISLDRKNTYWRVGTPTGSIIANSVIIAVQGYPEAAFASQKHNIVPFNYFQFATEPLSKDILETILPEHHGAWDTNLILSSYRLDAQGRLIVGSVGKVEGSAYDLHKSWAKRTIKTVFPQAGEVSLEYGWYGCIAMTTDHIPRFHVIDDNLAMVTCYNGRGIGPGTVFGKLLAEYMMGASEDSIPLPVSTIKPVSFRRLRGLFYEAGARMYHLLQRRI